MTRTADPTRAAKTAGKPKLLPTAIPATRPDGQGKPDKGARQAPKTSAPSSSPDLSTQSSLGPTRVTADDVVIQLRHPGTAVRFDLPHPRSQGRTSLADSPHEEGYLLGSAQACHFRIDDPQNRVSRKHARVFYKDGHWHLLDLGSKNGTFVDDVRQQAIQLAPGMVLRIGSVSLLAESRRCIELRHLLARFLGWGWEDDQAATVEKALQDLRVARMRRSPIWLHSQDEGDLSTIAQELHRRLFPATAPFVMCDARRQPGESDVRSPANESDFGRALITARGGTLCVRNSRLPQGLPSLLAQARTEPQAMPDVQIMILCERVALDFLHAIQGAISIPALRSRNAKQIEQVVHEVFQEAVSALSATILPLPSDYEWVMANASESFDEVVRSTRRLVALRQAGTIVGAAAILDMAPVSLRRWLNRRGMPQQVRDGAS